MEKRLVCFDMDNTLLDSNKTHLTAFNKAFLKNGLKKIDEKKIISLFGIERDKIIKILFPKLNKEKQKEVFSDVHRIMLTDTKMYVKPFNGVIKTLKKIKKSYSLGLLSNSKHDEILVMLRSAGVNKNLFDVLIGNDDVMHPKPAPDEIFKAQRLLHIEASYMIGDTIYDIMAGKRAGTKTIAILSGNQTRSFIEKTKPDYILEKIGDIERILL